MLIFLYKGSTKIWKDVACLMSGKSAVQCRSRWNYKLNPKRQFKKKCKQPKTIPKLDTRQCMATDEDSFISICGDSMSLDSSSYEESATPSETSRSLWLPDFTESTDEYHFDASPLSFSTDDPPFTLIQPLSPICCDDEEYEIDWNLLASILPTP